jgi:hypothetical protein
LRRRPEKPSKFEEFLREKAGKSADSIMVGMAVFMAVVWRLRCFFAALVF